MTVLHLKEDVEVTNTNAQQALVAARKGSTRGGLGFSSSGDYGEFDSHNGGVEDSTAQNVRSVQ